MKQYWQKIVARIDARSLRERAMIFAAAAVVLLALVNSMLIDPQFNKQKLLSQKLQQDQAQVALLRTEIQKKVSGQKFDPDVANRARLTQLKQQADQMSGQLREMQKGLVSPDKMSSLLEDIFKHNGKLRLVSLKTLPTSNLNDVVPADAKNATDKSAGAASTAKSPIDVSAVGESVYKHGVEIVVEGGYLDMLYYMVELEAMPWQLYWGKAKLRVDDYPRATLTLTLFTLSLDKKWLNL